MSSRLKVTKGTARLVGEEAPAPAPVSQAVSVQLREPTVVELAKNFGRAMGAWVAAGAPVVSEEAYRQRAEGCEGVEGRPACPFWDGAARLGLGKCGAPGCGCTRLKRWLATERCKHPDGSRWPS